MQNLSLQQKAAVQYVKGPLLILAGAGCGKTSLLAHKIAWLIREYEVAPSAIVALAASASTVHSLRRRAADALGREVPELTVSTFPEFGLAAVQQRPELLGLRPGFSLYDRLESEALVARLLRETQPPAAASADAVRRHIAAWKSAAVTPPAAQPGGTSPDAVAASLYETYQQRLRAANAIDFDDLAFKALAFYLADGVRLAAWRERVRFLLLDEYEHASTGEHRLMRLLAEDGPVVTVAVDDRRPGGGAAALASDFPDLRIIRLDHNFRSTDRIVTLADRLSRAPPPAPAAPLRHTAGTGAAAGLLVARSDQHEAETLASMLLEHKRRCGADYADYAILLRRAELAGPIEHALRARRVPYYGRGISSFFAQTEVRDLWAYLRLLSNPADDNAFLRAINTPRRDIDHEALQRLARRAAGRGRALLECVLDAQPETTPGGADPPPLRQVTELMRRLLARAEHADPAHLARDLLAELRYEEWLRDTFNDANIAARRMGNVTRLIDMLARLARRQPEANLRALMIGLNREAVREPEADEGASDGVALMTLSAARGTEFAHVYLVGFEEEADAAAQTDERDGAYLGVSRAREGVVFTVAEHRRSAGATTARRPSRFLSELAPHELERLNTDPGPGFIGRELARGAARLDRRSPPSR